MLHAVRSYFWRCYGGMFLGMRTCRIWRSQIIICLGYWRHRTNAEDEKWKHTFFANSDKSIYDAGLRNLVPRYEKCLERCGNYVKK